MSATGPWELSVFSSSVSELKRDQVLQQAVFEDNLTTSSQWMELVKQLQEDGHQELALKLMAIVTVTAALKQALKLHHAATQEENASDC